jgi:hypothetical protein
VTFRRFEEPAPDPPPSGTGRAARAAARGGADRAPGAADRDAQWEAQWAAQRLAVPREAPDDPHRAQAALGGLSAHDFGLLVSCAWHDVGGPLWIAPYVSHELLAGAPAWRRARAMLALVREEAATLTTHGELPPRLVVRAVEELDWPHALRPTVGASRLREADVPALTALVDALSAADLLDLGGRRSYAPFRLTGGGERTLAGESLGAAFGRFAAAVWREPAGPSVDAFRAAPGFRGVVAYALWTIATMAPETPADLVAEHSWPARLRAAVGSSTLHEVTRTGLLGQGVALGLLRLRRLGGRTVASRTELLDATVRTALIPFAWPERAG